MYVTLLLHFISVYCVGGVTDTDIVEILMIMMENQIENNIFHLMEVRNTGKNYHFDKK